MKGKMLFALPIAAIMTGGAFAGEISPYVSLKAGIGSASWENAAVTPTGITIMGAVGAGYALESVNLRGEFEFSMYNLSDTYTPFSTIELENTQKYNSYLANFYVDFLTDYKVKPYIGLGIGALSLTEELNVSSSGITIANSTYEETAFAYSINGGIGFNITDGLGGDVGVRYTVGAFDATAIGLFTASLGLRYTF